MEIEMNDTSRSRSRYADSDGAREIECEARKDALAAAYDTQPAPMPCPACGSEVRGALCSNPTCDYVDYGAIEENDPCPVCGAPIWGERCPDPLHGCDYLSAPVLAAAGEGEAETEDDRLLGAGEPW